jgi:hypothetical protein
MKKILLSLVVVGTALSAASHDMYPNSVTAIFGRSLNSESNNLEDGGIHGFRYNQNIYNATNSFSINSYQVALDFGNSVGYKDSNDDTSFIRLGGNLLWYLDTQSNLTPFVLLGAGFSYFSNPKDPQKTLSLYTNAGGGVELQIRNDIALVGEAKYLYEGPDRKSVNTNIGLKFSFGDN